MGVQIEESALRPPQPVAGTTLAGEFRCAGCGYGAVIQRVLPLCPMCGGAVWKSHGERPQPSYDD